MTTLDRLRASDPARDLDPTPPEDLLRAIVATPPERRRRRRRAALALVPVTAAALASLFLLPGGSTDLAARAYAQTAPDANSILYVRTTMHHLMEQNGKRIQDDTSRRERWQQGGRWRSVMQLEGEEYVEVRDADGTLHLPDGTTARREDGGDAEDYIDRSEPGFLANFRKAYENGTLDESGDTRFAGRAAKRFVVTERDNVSEYFLDKDTGMPLGSRQRLAIYDAEIGADRRPEPTGEQNGFLLITETVEALEHLPPTPENLAKLTDARAAGSDRPR